MKNLGEHLRSWTDWDGAILSVAHALGLFNEETDEHKSVAWTDNPAGTLALHVLDKLTEIAAVGYNESTNQYRWNESYRPDPVPFLELGNSITKDQWIRENLSEWQNRPQAIHIVALALNLAGSPHPDHRSHFEISESVRNVALHVLNELVEIQALRFDSRTGSYLWNKDYNLDKVVGREDYQ